MSSLIGGTRGGRQKEKELGSSASLRVEQWSREHPFTVEIDEGTKKAAVVVVVHTHSATLVVSIEHESITEDVTITDHIVINLSLNILNGIRISSLSPGLT